MGYALAVGRCVSCDRVFSFNPARVPSIRRTPDGDREPVCRNCIDRANVVRKQNGVEEIVPLPDAYDFCDEAEL